MKNLEVQPLALTPLTPIHVGCGQDFEPVNYVIDQGFLLHFDPSLAVLSTADRAALRGAIGTGGAEALPRLQRFFHDRREFFAGLARRAVAVAPGVSAQYEARIGQVANAEPGGARRYNQLVIERAAHHPHSGMPYLPGSSLKGAMRTGWLAAIFRPGEPDEKAARLEARLLKGTFTTDPFRLLHVADATGPEVGSEVVFATNHHHKAAVDPDTGVQRGADGAAPRLEVIVGGQYRALRGEVRFASLSTLHESGRTPEPDARIGGFSHLARKVNPHYLRVMRNELAMLEERGLCSARWVASIRELLGALSPALEDGRIMLLRVGRHSGADAVTLPEVRRISIRKGPGKPPVISTEGATMVRLAANSEDDVTGMLPFGWLLVEKVGSPDTPELSAWCRQQPRPDFEAGRSRLSAAQVVAREHAERLEHEARERARLEAQAAEAQRALESRRASMSDEARLIDHLRERLDAYAGRRQPVSGQLYQDARKLLLQAEAGAWSSEDRTALAELLEGPLQQKVDLGGKAKEIRAAASRLRGPA